MEDELVYELGFKVWTTKIFKFHNEEKDKDELRIEFSSIHGHHFIGYGDLCDLEYYKKHRIIVHYHGKTKHMAYFYKKDNEKTYSLQYVHRDIIKDVPNGFQVDHVNTNGLDNRRDNLRIVSPSDNIRNTRLRSDNSSGRKGVNIHKYPNSDKIYQVEACVKTYEGKRIRKTWYIPKYGYENAIKLASRWLDVMQPKFGIRISTETSKEVHKL